MSLQRTPFRSVMDASLCRRRQARQRWNATTATTWLPGERPTNVSVIEADVRGARLMFPYYVETNDQVHVAFKDELGYYQVRMARIAWTQNLGSSANIVAGVAFDEELVSAA